MRALFVAVVAATQLAQASFSQFPMRPPTLPVTTGSAVIMLTGSTNTTGYRIVIARDGSAEYISSAGRGTGTVPESTTAKFFADLASAAPLAVLPEGSCMKSASFGTSYFVYWEHSRSPDLTCTSGAGTTIADDAEAIASALGVQMHLRGMVRPMLPGEQHRPLPVASPTST